MGATESNASRSRGRSTRGKREYLMESHQRSVEAKVAQSDWTSIVELGGHMADTFDTEAGHKYFAAHCFNATWDLLDKESRTDEETEAMIDLAHASRSH